VLSDSPGRSCLPAVVLHTGGNIYSNITLWLTGQAEWQASSGPAALIWSTGADASFWIAGSACLIVSAAMVWAFFQLARAARPRPGSTLTPVAVG
jgi:hypothetical protein